MRSKTKLALAMAGVIAAGGAIATSFKGRLVCDQDPRFATAASCFLDTLSRSESALFGWTEPIPLTLYGPASEVAWVEPDASSEAIFVTSYVVDENTGDILAINDVLLPSKMLVVSSNDWMTESGE